MLKHINLRLLFIRWDPNNSSFSYDDLENSFNEFHNKSITFWKISKKLNPQVGEACIVSAVEKETGGNLAICGFIRKITEVTDDIYEIMLDAYFADTDCYPLFYASKFSKLSKIIDFDDGPEAELMDEEIVVAFHIIILRELAKQDILSLNSVESFFDGEMENIIRAIQDD